MDRTRVTLIDATVCTQGMVVNADGSINVNTGAAALTLGANGVVSVTNAETTILAANAARVNATVQNHGTSVVQIHFTPGQVFAAGPIQLQQYQSWNANQGGGVYTGIVYGIRAALAENVGVVEET